VPQHPAPPTTLPDQTKVSFSQAPRLEDERSVAGQIRQRLDHPRARHPFAQDLFLDARIIGRVALAGLPHYREAEKVVTKNVDEDAGRRRQSGPQLDVGSAPDQGVANRGDQPPTISAARRRVAALLCGSECPDYHRRPRQETAIVPGTRRTLALAAIVAASPDGLLTVRAETQSGTIPGTASAHAAIS
jgi:hypothetical protein